MMSDLRMMTASGNSSRTASSPNHCNNIQQYISQQHTHTFFTVPKRSCGKVMFLHLSVSHSGHRGVSSPVHAGIHTHPPADTLLSRHPPGQTPPNRWLLLWTVRILLECILFGRRVFHPCLNIPLV